MPTPCEHPVLRVEHSRTQNWNPAGAKGATLIPTKRPREERKAPSSRSENDFLALTEIQDGNPTGEISV
jgi:hypothetical protein